MHELRDILTTVQGGNNETVLVECEGYTYRVNLTGKTIHFLNNQNQKHCIKIEINEDEVYLDDYYLEQDIQTDCPKLSHKLFFKFLRALGHLFKKPVKLIDASSKYLEHTVCRINSEIFSLAGKPTFYERFGFSNANYTRAINQLKDMTVAELIDIHRVRQSSRTNKSQLRMKELLETFGMDLNTPVQTVANYVIRRCKSSHEYNKEFRRRGYDAFGLEVPMVRTRRFNLPKRETQLLDELMTLLKSYVHSAEGIPIDIWFTMKETEHYARD